MKKIMLVFTVSMGIAIANAANSYLYFQVDQSSEKNQIPFAYARVSVDNVMDYLNVQGTASSWVSGETPYTTDFYYVDMGDYDNADYSFRVELYDSNFTKIGYSMSVGYNDLKPFIATEMGQGGVTSAWTVSEFAAIPEPTTGTLLLLGLGVLALRRKRHCVYVMALLICFNAWADANDTLIIFATVGPDKYADGSTVKDGECYALVWVKNDATFAGFAADGNLVDETNSVLLLTAPIAKDGKCPTTSFEINAKLAEKYATGSFEVYLLDTRFASGAVGGVSSNGRATAINGYGKVEISMSGNGKAKVIAQSAIPADTPQPKIKAIKVIGGNVYLTVSRTVPYLQYKPMKVNLAGECTSNTAADPVQGVSGDDIILVVPTTGSSGFYKVGRN